MNRKYLLIIEDAGENFCAYFPDVPGCTTTGATVEEIRVNAAEALELHLDEDTAPRARTLAEIAADPEVLLDGSEIIAWLDYEHGKTLAPA